MFLAIRSFRFLCLVLLFSISINNLFSANYKQINLPQFHKKSLLNGLEFLLFPSNNSRDSFALMIRNGAAFDPINKWGLTYLTTQMMLENTEHRTGQHIRESLKQMNAELEFRVGWDAITFWGSAPPDRMMEVLNLLAEIVVAPQFTDETFTNLRDRLAQQIEQELQQLISSDEVQEINTVDQEEQIQQQEQNNNNYYQGDLSNVVGEDDHGYQDNYD